MFKSNLLKIFFIIVIFTIFVIFTFQFTYSKFVHSEKVNNSTSVAKLVFEVIPLSEKISKDELKLDEELEYKFRVQNFSNNISSDVKSKYNITLELSQPDPPLTIELYKIDGENEELIELENLSTKIPEIFEINQEYRDYKVKVKTDKTKNTTIDEGFNIQIKAISVQEEG